MADFADVVRKLEELKVSNAKVFKSAFDDNKELKSQTDILQKGLEEEKKKAADKAKEDAKKDMDNAALQALAAKTLGVSQKSYDDSVDATKKADDAQKSLDATKAEIQRVGGSIEGNKKIQKEQLKIDKLRRQAELKAMPLPTRIKEMTKDLGSNLNKMFRKYMGPTSMLVDGIASLSKGLFKKAKETIGGLFGVLKTGALVVGIAALLAFLDSEYFKELKTDLIPKLEAGLKRMGDFFNRVFDGFFGEDGSFAKGIEEIMTTFMTQEQYDSLKENLKNVMSGVGAVGSALGFLGKGFYDIGVMLGLIKEEEGKETEKNVGAMIAAFAALAAFLMPGVIFKGLFSAGKWMIMGTLTSSIGAMIGGLKGLATAISNQASRMNRFTGTGRGRGRFGRMFSGLGKLLGVVPHGASAMSGGPAGGAKPITKPVTKPQTNVPKMSDAANKGINMFRQFPRLLAVARAFAPLGALLTTMQVGAILLDKSISKEEKIEALGGALGGALGAAGFGLLGATLGSVIPGPGTLIGGALGSLVGWFGGEWAGKKVAKFLLGKEDPIIDNMGMVLGGAEGNTAIPDAVTTTDPMMTEKRFGGKVEAPNIKVMPKSTGVPTNTAINPNLAGAGMGNMDASVFNSGNVYNQQTYNNSYGGRVIDVQDPYQNKLNNSLGF